VPIVSDESLGELWLEPGERPPSLAAGDPGRGVLAVGSLSKTVWGGLRTGWMRADPEYVRRLALARGSQDVGSPVLDQLLAVEVLERLDALLPGRRALLRERRDALLAALPPSWRADRPGGGMSVWAELPEGAAAEALGARTAPREPPARWVA
jgi:DNA-binding transcriptional MocR family regulator